MNGSYSIKAALPALVPEMGYDDQVMGNGGDASISFERMIYDKETNFDQLRKDLLEYCKMDTWAMVKILKCLESL